MKSSLGNLCLMTQLGAAVCVAGRMAIHTPCSTAASRCSRMCDSSPDGESLAAQLSAEAARRKRLEGLGSLGDYGGVDAEVVSAARAESGDQPDAADEAAGGFRFSKPPATKAFPAGLDPDPGSGDMRLFRLAAIGGRVLTFATLASLAFQIYIGLSGGITDGWDRFDEPIEDIRVTMQRQETKPVSPI